MRAFKIFLLVFFFSAAFEHALAANIPWKGETFSYHSEQEPLSSVFRHIAAIESLPIVVSDKVTEIVDLHYEAVSIEQVFNDLISVYGLMWYYDGFVLYVYDASEIVTATIKLQHATPASFISSLNELGVLDDRFNLNTLQQSKLILLAAPKRMIDIAMEIAKVIDVADNPSQSAIFQWTDDDGIIHYSSTPPTNKIPEEIYYTKPSLELTE